MPEREVHGGVREEVQVVPDLVTQPAAYDAGGQDTDQDQQDRPEGRLRHVRVVRHHGDGLVDDADVALHRVPVHRQQDVGDGEGQRVRPLAACQRATRSEPTRRSKVGTRAIWSTTSAMT